MRAEKIAREAAIFDEIETHNALLGGTGKLGCAPTEIADTDRRRELLASGTDFEPLAAGLELIPEQQAALKADLEA